MAKRCGPLMDFAMVKRRDLDLEIVTVWLKVIETAHCWDPWMVRSRVIETAFLKEISKAHRWDPSMVRGRGVATAFGKEIWKAHCWQPLMVLGMMKQTDSCSDRRRFEGMDRMWEPVTVRSWAPARRPPCSKSQRNLHAKWTYCTQDTNSLVADSKSKNHLIPRP